MTRGCDILWLDFNCVYRSDLSVRVDRSAEAVGWHATPDASNYICGTISGAGGVLSLCPLRKQRVAREQARPLWVWTRPDPTWSVRSQRDRAIVGCKSLKTKAGREGGWFLCFDFCWFLFKIEERIFTLQVANLGEKHFWCKTSQNHSRRTWRFMKSNSQFTTH